MKRLLLLLIMILAIVSLQANAEPIVKNAISSEETLISGRPHNYHTILGNTTALYNTYGFCTYIDYDNNSRIINIKTRDPWFYINSTEVYVEYWLYASTLGYGMINYHFTYVMQANRPTHKETGIGLNTNNPVRWERSYDNGATWEFLPDSALGFYLESDPQRGTALYRVLNGDGSYTPLVTVNYFDEVPSTIISSPETSTKTVDESITFTTDVTDDGYTYQWNLNGTPIAGATSHDYTIPEIKAAHAGTYTCTVSNEVSSTTTRGSTLVVNRAPQVITFPELDARTFGDPDFTLPEKTDKNLTIVYQSSNPAVATVSSNIVHLVAPGETNIIATQSGTQDYLEAAYVSRKLVVNKRNQTITFPQPETRTYGDPEFSLPETTDEGLTISYKVINTQVAQVRGNVVTPGNAGTTEIVATQQGDATHYAAVPVTRTLTINKASQRITLPPFAPKVYGDAPVILNEVSDKQLVIKYTVEGDAVSIDGNILSILKPGSAIVTASQEGNNNYLPAKEISQTITVSKAPQTITWAEIPNMTYGDAPLTLPATTDKGLAITYVSSDESVARIEGNRLIVAGAGSADITASQEGNDFFNAALSVTLTINVAKAYQTITFEQIPEVTYGVAPLTLNAVADGSATVRFESSNDKIASVEGNILTINGAGTCHITAYAQGDANYYDATPVSRQLNVIKCDQTIEFASIEDLTYGDMPFTLNASCSTGKTVTFRTSDASVISINGSLASVRGAGNVVITAIQAGDGNYQSASSTISVKVNKASLIARAEDKQRIYGDDNPEFTISYTGFVNGDGVNELERVPTAVCEATLLSNVGNYVITINEVIDRNYSFIYQEGTLTVNKASLTVTAEDKTRLYGDANPALTYRFSGFRNLDSERDLMAIPTLHTNAKSTSPVGEYPIIVEGAVLRNYEPVYVEGTLTIEKAEITAVLSNSEREYGLENEYEISYHGFKCGDNLGAFSTLPHVVTSADITSNTGIYSMTLADGSAENYYFRYVYPNQEAYATIKITKAPLTITAEDKVILIGEPQPRLTMIFDGFRNDDTSDCLDRFPYIYVLGFTSEYPGDHPIVLEGGYDNNYDYTLVNGTLSVVRASSLDYVNGEEAKVIIENQTIIVTEIGDKQTVRIFDMQGHLMFAECAVNGSVCYTATASGIYIVTIGTKSIKVRI